TPAPPPLSEAAIVRALATATCTPFAGMTRIRFDGCDLSPAGHPGRRSLPCKPQAAACPELLRTIGQMVLDLLIPFLDGLVEDDEIAHRRDEPARAARTVALPEGLDNRVREAIEVPALYTHQREAWDAAARGEHVVVTTGTAS